MNLISQDELLKRIDEAEAYVISLKEINDMSVVLSGFFKYLRKIVTNAPIINK